MEVLIILVPIGAIFIYIIIYYSAQADHIETEEEPVKKSNPTDHIIKNEDRFTGITTHALKKYQQLTTPPNTTLLDIKIQTLDNINRRKITRNPTEQLDSSLGARCHINIISYGTTTDTSSTNLIFLFEDDRIILQPSQVQVTNITPATQTSEPTYKHDIKFDLDIQDLVTISKSNHTEYRLCTQDFSTEGTFNTWFTNDLIKTMLTMAFGKWHLKNEDETNITAIDSNDSNNQNPSETTSDENLASTI